ncbi:MAG: hypothetical protein R6V67_07645 [Spirochaetia bacterium]
MAAGTLSHGPVFAWYPFLSDLQGKGVSNGKIAAFLFARAVKIPLLAAMVFYFGLPRIASPKNLTEMTIGEISVIPSNKLFFYSKIQFK